VFFALPPNSATIADFLSFVTLDISIFLNSSKIYIQNLAAKVGKMYEITALFHVFQFETIEKYEQYTGKSRKHRIGKS
jgi:hypothetical protein